MFHYEVRDGVALMTIDRPEARNAIDTPTSNALIEAKERIDADPSIVIGVVTGSIDGPKPMFSAGADLKELRDRRFGQGDQSTAHRLADLLASERSTPWIAAVDGPALAGGCELVLWCDLVVASTRSSFGIPEVKRCLVAGAGGVYRMARKIPVNIAMECALTGDPITAERAHTFGLVNELVEPGEALPRALDLATRVAVNAPLAVATSRRVLLASFGVPDREAFSQSMEAVRFLIGSEDYQEGLDAFVEKRAPVWKGR
jgi:enoyl-CoA hydratase